MAAIEGVAYVHSVGGSNGAVSLIHNDINMDNLLLGKRDGRDVPLLNDFNIAVFRNRDAETGEPCRFRGRFANPQWMSPEQQERPSDGLSSGVLDETIDVYALGNILYKIAVGRSPWKHDFGDKINTPEIKGKIARAKIRGAKPKVPPDVKESAEPGVRSVLTAMERCYRNDPSKRPTARELAAYLRGELRRIDVK